MALPENAAFAEQLAANNIIFIGPPTGAITAMGDKSRSCWRLRLALTQSRYTDVVKDVDRRAIAAELLPGDA